MMSERLAAERRNNGELSVYDHFHGKKRVHDHAQQLDIIKIFTGDWYVSTQGGEMLATVLGSCVSACIRDPERGIGGMNHFLLPETGSLDAAHSDAARYGMHAMECLINGILKAGGRKERLEVKVFGGGNVINNSARIGSKNAAFIRDYLRREGYKITSEDMEGDHPRRVDYFPDTGKVMMRLLRRKEDLMVLEEEDRYTRKISKKPLEGDIELF